MFTREVVFVLLAVFRSRTETLNFASILRSYNVQCIIVNTPRNINVACGISVKFNRKDIDVAKMIVSRRGLSTFGGFFEL